MSGIAEAIALATAVAPVQQTVWTVDKAHSSVSFTVSHLVISEVRGSFKVFDGTMRASEDLTEADVEFSVDVASINTDIEARDNHLRSDDFFSAGKYPAMTFKSIAWKEVADLRYELSGELQIRGVTNRVTFDVLHGGTAKDGYGNTKAGFKARAVIDRFAYGLKWNMLTEAGGMTVGKDVAIELNLQFARQSPS